MKERGIVMTSDSVRAILDDRKTQSRRLIRIDNLPVIVKVGPADPNAPADGAAQDLVSKGQRLQRGIPTNAVNVRFLGQYLKCDAPPGSNTVSSRVPCPYGEIGTRLYVKESWTSLAYLGRFGAELHYKADGHDPKTCSYEVREAKRRVIEDLPDRDDRWRPLTWERWRSPRFMPKWAARIWLELTEVRVQRLQEITEEDAKAEGCGDPPFGTRRESFQCLWDSINGKRAPWSENPWIWALTFKRAEAPAHV